MFIDVTPSRAWFVVTPKQSLGARQPGFGRWLSRDPIAEQGGINLYGYVEGNPVNLIDPKGLDTCASAYPNLVSCDKLGEEYRFFSRKQAEDELRSGLGDRNTKITPQEPKVAEKGPCGLYETEYKPGLHINYSVKIDRDIFHPSISCCQCCQDDLSNLPGHLSTPTYWRIHFSSGWYLSRSQALWLGNAYFTSSA